MAKFFCLYFCYIDDVGFSGYVVCLFEIVIVCDYGCGVYDMAVFLF